MPDARVTVALIGSAGDYGRWLQRFFVEQMELPVIAIDPADLASAPSSAAAQADVVVFCVPVRHTVTVIGTYQQLMGSRAADQLWLDVTSIKAAPVAAMLASAAEVVGLHPMTGPPKSPTLRGRVVVVCAARLQRWQPWLEQLLRRLEGEVVRCTPEEHDWRMAAVQNLTHASSLVQVAAMLAQPAVGRAETLWPFRTGGFAMDYCQAARMLAGNPDLYLDILQANPHALGMLQGLATALTQLSTALAAGDRERLREQFFQRGRDWFGDQLAAGEHGFEQISLLLADLSDRRALRVCAAFDQPGSLRDLLALFEDAGISLDSLHSARTAAGELHFRFGLAGAVDADSLAALADRIAASGLGRVLPDQA